MEQRSEGVTRQPVIILLLLSPVAKAVCADAPQRHTVGYHRHNAAGACLRLLNVVILVRHTAIRPKPPEA